MSNPMTKVKCSICGTGTYCSCSIRSGDCSRDRTNPNRGDRARSMGLAVAESNSPNPKPSVSRMWSVLTLVASDESVSPLFVRGNLGPSGVSVAMFNEGS